MSKFNWTPLVAALFAAFAVNDLHAGWRFAAGVEASLSFALAIKAGRQ
jgi:hypothetical protein